MNSDVFVVDAKPASIPRKLTTFAGTDEGPLSWSPDGKTIAYRQGTGEHYSIYEMPQLATVVIAPGKSTLVAKSLDNWPAAPVFAADGSSLLTHHRRRLPELSCKSFAGWSSDAPEQRRWFSEWLDAESWPTLPCSGPQTQQRQRSTLLKDGALRKLTSHNDAVLATLNPCFHRGPSRQHQGWERSPWPVHSSGWLQVRHQSTDAPLHSRRPDQPRPA